MMQRVLDAGSGHLIAIYATGQGNRSVVSALNSDCDLIIDETEYRDVQILLMMIHDRTVHSK